MLLDGEALVQLQRAGWWARWAGLVGAIAVVLASLGLVGVVFIPDKVDSSNRVPLAITLAIAIPLLALIAWISGRFGRATSAVALEEPDSVDRAMRVQGRLFTLYAVVGLLVGLLCVFALVMGVIAAMRVSV